MNDVNDHKVEGSPFFRLFSYFVPGPFFGIPFAFLFKKKIGHDKKEVPEYTLLVFFQNHMYQIFFPFCESDSHLFLAGKHNVSLPVVPLIIPSDLLIDGTDLPPKK